MKTLKSGIVEELREKHKERLALAQRALANQMGKTRTRSDSYISDVLLFSKWACHVGKGWYGFSLGDVPRVWTDVLDEFLSWLEAHCPDFEIQQVKMKFRRLRFHIDTKTDSKYINSIVHPEVAQLQKLLSLPPMAETPARGACKKHRKRSRKP